MKTFSRVNCRAGVAWVDGAGGARASVSLTGEILLRAPPEQARCGPRRPASLCPSASSDGLSSCSFVIGSLGWESVSYRLQLQPTAHQRGIALNFLSLFSFHFFTLSERTRHLHFLYTQYCWRQWLTCGAARGGPCRTPESTGSLSP